MKKLQAFLLFTFLVFNVNAHASEQFKYDDQTRYLREFIDNYESVNEENKPVYLEKKVTTERWIRLALIFGYGGNMHGCEKIIELMKEKYWLADYRCVRAD